MKHTVFIIIWLLPILYGCCTLSQDEKEMNRITETFSKQQKIENDLVTIGTGGAYPDTIREFHIHFISRKKISRDNARVLMVNLVERYLSLINSNNQIKPFLHHYPFTGNDLKIMIAFYDEYDNYALPPLMAFVFLSKGQIYYDHFDHSKGDFCSDSEEPYEEALKIVRGK